MLAIPACEELPVLVIDDSADTLSLLQRYTSDTSYRLIGLQDPNRALHLAETLAPRAIVLDVMMPQVDGWEVCRRVRASQVHGDLPIIMLTARDDDIDKIVGLELGADDYLTKPFNPRELVARVKAILRRAAPKTVAQTPTHVGDVVIHPARREVTVSGQPLNLRAKEFDLLLTFIQHKGIVLSREQLLDQVWGANVYVEERTVDVHIRRLRKALQLGEADYSGLIQTVRGTGYRFSSLGSEAL